MSKSRSLIPALMLLAGLSVAAPMFTRDQVEVKAEDWEYTQILYYNYTTDDVDIEDEDDGNNSYERALQREGYVEFFLYDYDAGYYTESLLVGHRRY